MRTHTILYLATIVVFIGGMWTILVAGAKLQAPADIAGDWRPVVLISTDRKDPARKDSAKTDISVRQSGRFVNVSLRGGPPIALRVIEEDRPSPTTRVLKLKGKHQSVIVTTPDPSASPDTTSARFEFRGSINETVVATREEPESELPGNSKRR